MLPNEASLQTRLTDKINLNTPLISAAMDTVTESAAAITMAREGGIGIVHKNMGIDQQVLEVERVKKSESLSLPPRIERTMRITLLARSG